MGATNWFDYYKGRYQITRFLNSSSYSRCAKDFVSSCIGPNRPTASQLLEGEFLAQGEQRDEKWVALVRRMRVLIEVLGSY